MGDNNSYDNVNTFENNQIKTQSENIDSRNNIFYNESVLTPPNKKINGIIIGIFIFLIALLLFGIIGLVVSIEQSREVNGYDDFGNSIKNIFDSLFEDDETDYNFDENGINDNLYDFDTYSLNENDGEAKVIYNDPSYDIILRIPDDYTIASDASSSKLLLLNLTDDDDRIIYLTAKYEMLKNAEKEYEAVKHSGNKYIEFDKLYKTKFGDAKIITIEASNMYETVAVIGVGQQDNNAVRLEIVCYDISEAVFSEQIELMLQLLDSLDYIITDDTLL